MVRENDLLVFSFIIKKIPKKINIINIVRS